MEIRGEDARRLNIRTLSEAAKYAPQWRAGFGYEFMERPDGYRRTGARPMDYVSQNSLGRWISGCWRVR